MELVYILVLLYALTTSPVWAEGELEKSYSKHFSNLMRTYISKSLKANLENLKVFYRNKIEDTNLRPEQKKAFEQRLNLISEIKGQISNDIDYDFVKATILFGELVFSEQLTIQSTPEMIEDPTKVQLFIDLIKQPGEKKMRTLDELLTVMNAKLAKLYPSNEESKKEEEHEDSNESLENILSVDVDFSKAVTSAFERFGKYVRLLKLHKNNLEML